MRYLFVAIVICFFVFGRANASAQGFFRAKEKIQDSHALAQTLVARIVEKYRAFTRDSFEGEVSANFVPGRSEFISQAERNSLAGVIISFDYFIEKAVRSTQKLSVKIKWEKKAHMQGASSPQLTRGIATLVFQMRVGRWQLYRVTGDNPF